AEHRVEVHDAASEQFASRLRKMAKERRKWARREEVQCYRVYDSDLPEYAVAIDIYEGAGESAGKTFVHVAEYQAPSSVDAVKARRRFEDVLAIVPAALGVRPDHVFSKVRRREKGGGQYRDAGRRSYVAYTAEGGCLFEVDLSGYLDTGLFLDHRSTRLMVGERAAGKRFLNLFAYTGSATVHAANGGAVETTTVDLSQTYLDWARRNMELNGFSGERHSFVRGDVMEWITATRRQLLRYDLIFVDPPTFSNSKAMGTRTWDVQRDHVELLIGVSRLLTAGGEAVFSCNLRTFKPDMAALERYGVHLEDITAQTIPHDFERNPRIHKCYLLRRA
ncbi:MAG: class I SAM-dependent methyltransferase, partial [Eggerthellaceae bacterium]|nr:class I SAM-dependent methyltransferase [Eggerthellaceae bacterium]